MSEREEEREKRRGGNVMGGWTFPEVILNRYRINESIIISRQIDLNQIFERKKNERKREQIREECVDWVTFYGIDESI